MTDETEFEITFNQPEDENAEKTKHEPYDGEEDDEMDEEDFNRLVFPNKYTLRSNTLSFSLYDDEEQMFVNGTGVFEVMYQPYGAQVNGYRHSRLSAFFENIDGSFFLSSTSKINPLFCSGTFNNISFEIPNTHIDLNKIIAFMYYKARALLGEYGEILMFKFTPEYDNISIYVDCNIYNTRNPYIVEDEWMDGILSYHEDSGLPFIDENDEEVAPEDFLPWWHRDDSTTRDYSYGDADGSPSIIAMDLPDKIPTDEEQEKYPLFLFQLESAFGLLNEQDDDSDDSDDSDDGIVMGDGVK